MSFDFKTYIEENFDPKPQQMNPDQVSINCINPDCEDNWQRKRKMTVNTEQELAFCFKCDARYNDVEFVSIAEGITKFQALKMVRTNTPKRTYGPNRFEMAIESLKKAEPESDKKSELMPALFPPVKEITPGSPGWNYLADRNFGKEIIDYFGLLFAPMGPPNGELCPECSIRKAGKRCCPFAGRIIIPIWHDGDIISFQARTIGDSIPKYLFPIDNPFDSVLYNWDSAKDFDTVILTEGVTSLWRTWLHGFHNVASTFGKSLKQRQEETLKREKSVKRIIMLWDGGTLSESHAAGRRLAKTKEVLIARLPGKLDPDECLDAPHYIRNAIPIQDISSFEAALSKITP